MIITETMQKQTHYTGTDLFIESLLEENVEVVFGAQNNTYFHLSYSLDKCEKIKHVFLKHEQATIHAADGYARATGKIGVALIPSQSAMTNAITGIATAQMDSVPLVVFICQHKGDESQQVDHYGMTLPITKYHFQMNDGLDIQKVVKEAFTLAGEGRPGPVIVEIAEEVVENANALFAKNICEEMGRKKDEVKFPAKLINQVITEIQKAKRPVLFIGGGITISGAGELITQLAERAQIPVVSSLMGIGAISCRNPLFLGMVGMHGTFAANKAVHQSDLLICLGVRFSDRVTGKISGFSPKSKKIQIDIDPAEINKIVRVDIPIVGDVKDFLCQLNQNAVFGNTSDWLKEASTWKKVAPGFSDSKSVLKPQKVIQLLDQYSNSNAIVATDVGQHQMWTAHHYKFKQQRTFLTSGGLGTMGYGLPAAIGAALANKENEIICISGDGSFQMNFQELMTVAKYQLPIKIAILKNGYLGMVRQWQEMFYHGRYSSVKITSPDFVKLAEAYGIRAKRANTLLEAENIIKQAFTIDKPIVMEFDISEEENVFPIVPPGENNAETLLKK